MARRGTFGRQPRSAPNLTNELVSIARQMESQRDQNLMDAWKNGGLFEGEKATDEVVLAHWKDRLANVSKDDPLWDSYNNAYMQYDYSIHESKATLANAQGKMSDAALAGFYSGWAKKVPKDSEFYRVLMRDAAQWMRAAKQRSTAGVERAKEAAYKTWQENAHAKGEAGMEFLINGLRTMANTGVQSLHTVGLFNQGGSDFADFDPSDPEQMIELLGRITAKTPGTKDGDLTTSATYNPTAEVVFHDAAGKAWTGKDFISELKRLNPTFKGDLTTEYVNSVIVGANHSLDERIAKAVSTGHQTDANELRKSKTYVQSIGTQFKSWPVETDYMHAVEEYNKVMLDPSSTPQDKNNAYAAKNQRLEGYIKDPRIAENDAMRASMQAEIDGNPNATSVADNYNQMDGNKPFDPNKPSTIALQVRDQTIAKAMVDGVALPIGHPDKLYNTQGTYDKDGNFKPSPAGMSFGATSMAAIINSSPNAPKSMQVPNPGGAGFMEIWVTGRDVSLSAVGANGKSITLRDSNPVAAMYSVNIGGQMVNTYEYTNADGKRYLSKDAPWDESKVHAAVTPGGVELTLDPSALPALDAKNLKDTGWTVTGKKNPTKDNPLGNAGELVMDPQVVLRNTLPDRAHAGPDPFTDFGTQSLTMATLMQTPEGRLQLTKLKDNPAFIDAIDKAAHTSAGQTPQYNRDGSIAGWLGGDKAAYDRSTAQAAGLTQQLAAHAVSDWFMGLFDKSKTNPTGDGVKYPLSTDQLRNQDNLLYPLASSATPGTNNFPQGNVAIPSNSITLGHPLKVPTLTGKQQDDLLAPYKAPAPTYGPSVYKPLNQPDAALTPPPAPSYSPSYQPPAYQPPGAPSKEKSTYGYQRNL